MKVTKLRLCLCWLCAVLAIPLSVGGGGDPCKPLLFLASLASEDGTRWSALQEEYLDLQTILSPEIDLVTFSFGVDNETSSLGYVGDVQLERTIGDAFGFRPQAADRDTVKILAAVEVFCRFSDAVEEGNEREDEWEREKDGVELQKRLQRVAQRRKASGCGGPSWLVVLRDSDLPDPVELLRFLDSELERELRHSFPLLSVTDSDTQLQGSLASRFRAVAGERRLVRNLAGNCGDDFFDAVNCAGHYVGANSIVAPGEVPLAFSARLATDLRPATPFLKRRGSTSINVGTWMVGSDDVMFLDLSGGIQDVFPGFWGKKEGGRGKRTVGGQEGREMMRSSSSHFCFRSGGGGSPILRFLKEGLEGGGSRGFPRVFVSNTAVLGVREREREQTDPNLNTCLIVLPSNEAQGAKEAAEDDAESSSEGMGKSGSSSGKFDQQEESDRESEEEQGGAKNFPFVRIWSLWVSEEGDVRLGGQKGVGGRPKLSDKNLEEVFEEGGQEGGQGDDAGCSVGAPEFLLVISSRWRNWRRRRRLRTALTAFAALAGVGREEERQRKRVANMKGRQAKSGGPVPFRFVFLLGAPPASLSESDRKGVIAEAQNSGDVLIQDGIGDEINVVATAHTAYALERPSDGSERRHDAGLHPLAMKIARAAHLFLSPDQLPRPFWEGELAERWEKNSNASECASRAVSDWLFIVDDDSFVNPLQARRLLRNTDNGRGQVIDPRRERRLVANIANSPLEVDFDQWIFPYFHAAGFLFPLGMGFLLSNALVRVIVGMSPQANPLRSSKQSQGGNLSMPPSATVKSQSCDASVDPLQQANWGEGGCSNKTSNGVRLEDKENKLGGWGVPASGSRKAHTKGELGGWRAPLLKMGASSDMSVGSWLVGIEGVRFDQAAEYIFDFPGSSLLDGKCNDETILVHRMDQKRWAGFDPLQSFWSVCQGHDGHPPRDFMSRCDRSEHEWPDGARHGPWSSCGLIEG
uniref:Uncharacterized protein n=1 Tax=Chromera velia CCMP2878 TaxID=1169474 RepID=A0A0G4GAM2_9ALVE|eukprot:Cvel_20923.t1-p1 / transcript=Cvel_20923.t1 / gene=Cvel_20923 / organism=Chromera_velia_CCMP2878 / gene_product=hypothetical protein / transcript_product=hypothetical protein / location=Cvel_scaffold1920:13361-17709(-) / protein_length=977 / sequence_SO=supercontig / SO=protein_coding / is_pseudo=false